MHALEDVEERGKYLRREVNFQKQLQLSIVSFV
jgi:hypothetical protein